MREVMRPPATASDAAPDGSEDPTEFAPTASLREVFRRFWPDAKPFWRWLWVSLALALVSPAVDVVAIFLFKTLVDDVLTPRDFHAFPPIAAAFVGVTLLVGGLGFLVEYLNAWIGENFLHRMRTRVFAHLHTLSMSFFDRRQLGDTLSRLTGDVGAIESVVLFSVLGAVSSVLKIVVFAIVLFIVDWRLAVVSLLAAPVFWAVARFFAGRIKAVSREVRARAGSITTVAEESLGNEILIQAYGRESAEVSRFSRQSLASVRAELAATRLSALFAPLVDLMHILGVLTILGFGIWELNAGRITLGGLLSFLVFLSQFYGPVRGLGALSTSVFAASAAAERIIDLLDQQPEVRAPAHPIPLGSDASGLLRLQNVSFTYPDSTTQVLHDVCVTVRPGMTTAVVGASGAGKTTLLKLLLRFYDPAQGHISLGGHDLRELDPAELRANIAFILQETLLLDGTIAENIGAGRPNATRQDIIAAAVAADAHGFISDLSDDYDTRVGQRGRLLSGGQRQRVAIARAMIRDAPVLLMDEPTTSLDAAATQRVLGPMRRLMDGRTSVVISHNLLTVTDADQIIYLEGGRVSGVGTHRELLAGSDGYAQLYRLHHPK
jgi:ATP-binding cassette subfamily B protein